MKPILRAVPGKNLIRKVMLGGGIDTSKTTFTTDIQTGTYLRNLSSRSYPALATREGRKVVFSRASAAVRGLGVRYENDDVSVLAVDGDVWGTVDNAGIMTSIQAFAVPATTKTFMLQFSGVSKVYSIVTDGANRYAWDGTSVINLALKKDGVTAQPATATHIVAAFKNRLFWGKGRTLYWSKLNDIQDYEVGTSVIDGGFLTIAEAEEEISAITVSSGRIQIFTQNNMYELYGSGPSTFELVPVDTGIGCVGQFATATANGLLYFAWRNGIYSYNGASFKKISDNVDYYFETISKDYIGGITIAADSKYLYCAIPSGSSTYNNILLKYDFEKGLWFVDYGVFALFISLPDKVYGLNDIEGAVYEMCVFNLYDTYFDIDGLVAQQVITWEWRSPSITISQLKSRMTVSHINVMLELPTGSTAKLAYNKSVSDGVSFTDLKTFTASTAPQNVYIPVPQNLINDLNWFRLKLYGTGPCIVHFMEIHFRSQT